MLKKDLKNVCVYFRNTLQAAVGFNLNFVNNRVELPEQRRDKLFVGILFYCELF